MSKIASFSRQPELHSNLGESFACSVSSLQGDQCPGLALMWLILVCSALSDPSTEEAVNEVKRQAMTELQKAVSEAERKAHDMITTERAKMERTVAEAKRQAAEDALAVINQQEDSSEVRWGLPRAEGGFHRQSALLISGGDRSQQIVDFKALGGKCRPLWRSGGTCGNCFLY